MAFYLFKRNGKWKIEEVEKGECFEVDEIPIVKKLNEEDLNHLLDLIPGSAFEYYENNSISQKTELLSKRVDEIEDRLEKIQRTCRELYKFIFDKEDEFDEKLESFVDLYMKTFIGIIMLSIFTYYLL